MTEEKKEEAKDEFYQLRNDDKDFADQWGENDFEEWYKEVYLPSETDNEKEEVNDYDRQEIARLVNEGNTGGILDDEEGYRII